MSPTPIDRAAAIATWNQVEKATCTMRRLLQDRDRTPVKPEELEKCVEQGALSDQLIIAIWREVLADDDHATLAPMLRAATQMPSAQRLEIAVLAASQGAIGCMYLLLEDADPYYYLAAQPSILQAAVKGDQVPMAQLLFDRGALMDGVSTENLPHGTLGLVKSARMLDLLVANGAKLTCGAMMHCALKSRPNPSLLRAFLEHHTPLVPTDACVGKPWGVLFRDTDNQALYPQEHIECAKMLLQAGCDALSHRRYLAQTIYILVKAGLDPNQVLTQAIECQGRDAIIGGTSFPTSGAPWKNSIERAEVIEQMLSEAADMGLDLHALRTQSPNQGFDRLFVRAGLQLDPPSTRVLPEDVAVGLARHLARTTRATLTVRPSARI